MNNRRVVILGGYGTFGRLITEQLAQSGADVVIAGRDATNGPALAASLGAEFIRCDAQDAALLRSTVANAYLLINASGPFQAADYSIPRICIDQGCHYVDLGDGRDYVAGITQLHERALAQRVFVCAGASTTPAITSAAVMALQPHFKKIRSIKVALTAGNKNQAGVSTIASILAYVGVPVRVWQHGRWRAMHGWGLGETIRFPWPVGRRRVQLCDVPDLELFPALFQADEVVFKAGVELTVLNYAIAAMGLLRRLWPTLNLPAFAKPLVTMSKLFKPFGTYRGSFAVFVNGEPSAQVNGEPSSVRSRVTADERAIAFVAPRNGPRVPAAPALLLARKLLTSGPPAFGAFPCVGFLSLDEFASHLAAFDIFVVYGENGTWATAGP